MYEALSEVDMYVRVCGLKLLVYEALSEVDEFVGQVCMYVRV